MRIIVVVYELHIWQVSLSQNTICPLHCLTMRGFYFFYLTRTFLFASIKEEPWQERRGTRLERLQKYLARSGVASRRQAEEMIKSGLVMVNGQTVTEMGLKVDPDRDSIVVSGREVKPEESFVYLLLNKPSGVVTTLKDPEGRTTVAHLLQEVPERVYPVGRLDYETEGLLLLTNDGQLAFRLSHPRFKVPKTYVVKTAGRMDGRSIEKLRRGVMLEDGVTMPAQVKFIKGTGDSTWLELTITEGRNRQVRRMCDAVGHPVLYLQRTRYGPLSLGNLEPGRFRALTPAEVKELKRACGLENGR